MTTITTKEFGQQICEFLKKQMVDEYVISIVEDKENNQFFLAAHLANTPLVSLRDSMVKCPIQGSATESYLALAEQCFNSFLVTLDEMRGEFLTDLTTAFLPVHQKTSEEYLFDNIRPEDWEHHIFNVGVELALVKSRMETNLKILSDIRHWRSFMDAFRAQIVKFARSNNLRKVNI